MENFILRWGLRLSVLTLGLLLHSFVVAANGKFSHTVEFTTFNLAHSNAVGFSLVRDIGERSIRILTELEKKLEHRRILLNLDPTLHHDLVFAFQESIIRKTHRRLIRWAENRGLYIAESDSQGDLLFFSTAPIVGSRFKKFSKNEIGRNFGVQEILVELSEPDNPANSRLIRVVQTHTSFSTPGQLKPEHGIHLKEIAEFIHSPPAVLPENTPEVFLGDINMSRNLRYRNGMVDGATPAWGSFVTSLKPRLEWIPNDDPTWDEINNPLARDPAVILRIIGLGSKGKGWGLQNTVLDHIFKSAHWTTQSIQVTFKEPVEVLSAFEPEEKARRFVQLSDHYGCSAILKL